MPLSIISYIHVYSDKKWRKISVWGIKNHRSAAVRWGAPGEATPPPGGLVINCFHHHLLTKSVANGGRSYSYASRVSHVCVLSFIYQRTRTFHIRRRGKTK